MFPYDLDLSWVIALQSIGDWIFAPMKFFSFLGAAEFYIFFIPILYWCIDATLGLRVGVATLFSLGLNLVFKIPFHGPRPYWMSANVKPLWAETTFGIPSGHAQYSIMFWGVMAEYLRRAWIWVAAILLIFFIGISRVFLGAHFFRDILLGWLIGSLLFGLFLRYWDKIVNWAKKLPTGTQVLYAFLFSIGLVVIGALVVAANSDFVIPEEWLVNASRIGEEEISPLSLSDIMTTAGTLFGMLAGVAFLAPRGGWQVSGSFTKRSLRYIVGLVGILVIWYGLGEVFPRGETLLTHVLRYLRYSLLGFWLAAGAPMMFTKLKLS